MSRSNNRPALWMMSGAFWFALMGVLTHALGSRCDWLVIALTRALFMFGLAVVMARIQGVRLVVWEPRTLWIRSLAGSVSLVCNFYAMTRLPIADVMTLTNTYPLWILVLSCLAARVRPTFAELTGVVLGLCGVLLIQRPEGSGNRAATVIALASSVSTAVAMLGLHRLRGIDPRAIVAHFSGVASLFAAGWMLLRSHVDVHAVLQPTSLVMLLGVGVTGTIGQLLLTKAYAAGPPGEVSIVGLSQVVFAMGFDVALWGRRFTPWTLLGFALVLGPTAWMAGRAQRRAVEVSGSPREVAGVGAPES